MIDRLDVLCFVGIDLLAFSTFSEEFPFSKTSGSMKKVSGSDILL